MGNSFRLMLESLPHLNKSKVISVIQQCIQEYNRNFAFGGRSIDFSAVDSNVEPLAKNIHSLAFVLCITIFRFNSFHKDATKNNSIDVSNSPELKNLLEILLQSHWNCQSFLRDQFVDIFDFCERLKSECEKSIRQTGVNLADLTAINNKLEFLFWLNVIKYLCEQIDKSKDLLVKNGVYVGDEFQFSNGISIYFPWSYLGLFTTKEEYENLKFVKDFPFVYLFHTVHTVLTARPAQILPVGFTGIDGAEFSDLIDIFAKFKTTEFFAFLLEKLPKLSTKIFGDNDIEEFQTTFLQPTINLLTLEKVRSFLELSPLFDPPRSKFDPPRSKGLGNFLNYFGRTNNIFPKLNIEGTFPPKTYSEIKN